MAESKEKSIGFFGAGQMARALAGGFVAQGRASESEIHFFDPSPEAGDAFLESLPKASLCASNSDVADACGTLFVAVKPHFVKAVTDEVKDSVHPSTVVVSVAAGVSLGTLEQWFEHTRVIRVMPNTPCLIGRGAAGLARGAGASDDDVAKVVELMSAVGVCEEVTEPLLDVVTGLSGSGPAYVFLILDALIEGGVKAGLPRDVATRLAKEMLAGSAELAIQSGLHPSELRDRVTSPGGTTAAGLHELERHGVRAALSGAIDAATKRARELGAANG